MTNLPLGRWITFAVLLFVVGLVGSTLADPLWLALVWWFPAWTYIALTNPAPRSARVKKGDPRRDGMTVPCDCGRCPNGTVIVDPDNPDHAV